MACSISVFVESARSPVAVVVFLGSSGTALGMALSDPPTIYYFEMYYDIKTTVPSRNALNTKARDREGCVRLLKELSCESCPSISTVEGEKGFAVKPTPSVG